MTIKLSAISLTLAAVMAGAVVAQVPGQLGEQQAPVEQVGDAPRFEVLDKNGDGGITGDEARDTWLASVFYQVDTDRDGAVTKSEYQQATS